MSLAFMWLDVGLLGALISLSGAVMLGRAVVAHGAPVVWRGMGHSARAQGGQPQSFLAHLLGGVNDLSLLTSVLLAPGSGEHQPRELLCHEM